MTDQLLEVNGLQLACSESGEGTPLVLLHGFPFDRRMWQGQVDSLSRSCRVVSIDLRGFGDSQQGPTDATEGVCMKTYAGDVIGVLDALGIDEPVVVAGFSMGGYITWQLALRHAERIRGLVLVDTRSKDDTQEVRVGRLTMAESITQLGAKPDIEPILPKLLAPATIQSRPGVVASVREMMLRCSPGAIAAAQRGMSRRKDVTERLAEIGVPALAICGSEDVVSPPGEMRRMAEALPRGEYCEIAGAGHLTPIEEPDAVSEAMGEFLAGL